METLGAKFALRFGKETIMSHYDQNYVYIQNRFGEPISSFTNAYDSLVSNAKYGITLKNDLPVIIPLPSSVELYGTFEELQNIVYAIKGNKNLYNESANGKKETLRLYGVIKDKEIIKPITLDNDTFLLFFKMWFKSIFNRMKYTIWAIEYNSKEKYCIIINQEKI